MRVFRSVSVVVYAERRRWRGSWRNWCTWSASTSRWERLDVAIRVVTNKGADLCVSYHPDRAYYSDEHVVVLRALIREKFMKVSNHINDTNRSLPSIVCFSFFYSVVLILRSVCVVG